MAADKNSNDDLIGQTIAGRYRIISRLGAGGMGVAYRAWDEQDGVPVVIKIPKKIFLEDPKFAERFHREIRLLQGLSHPHVVPIRDVGEHEGLPFVVLRFLPGGSLSDRRLRDGQGKPRPNPAPMLQLWLPAVAEALDYVHSQGVVHRDVKPANIFFDAFWGAFLGDFGIAKIVEESETFDKEHTLTATHMGIGTQEYMSPEQFTPKAVIDGRTDQYALAVTVYEMLAGVRPFSGATAHLVVEVTSHAVPPLQAKRRDVPKSLVEAVHKGLSKNASARFRTCREFAEASLRDVPPMKTEPDVARLLCPKCSKILTLPTHAAGQKGRCPKCHTNMKVADDLGALWLLDEARRQRVPQPLVEIDASEPEPAVNEIPEEDLKDFRPISTPMVVGRRYLKGRQSRPWLIPAGIATAFLLAVAITGISRGWGKHRLSARFLNSPNHTSLGTRGPIKRDAEEAIAVPPSAEKSASVPVAAIDGVKLDLVPVGDTGNPADTNGFGKVDYEYMIGRYEVTNEQYCEFLNAVARNDPYGLYSEGMQKDGTALSIERSGTEGNYSYKVMQRAPDGHVNAGAGLSPLRPVACVSWMSAARFCNWLHNGQRDGATESGAYALNGLRDQRVQREKGARFFLPTEDEWYKAAYYRGSRHDGEGSYWKFAVRSNDAPQNWFAVAIWPFEKAGNWKGHGESIRSQQAAVSMANWGRGGGVWHTLAPVNHFPNTVTDYGCQCMCGNVAEWLDPREAVSLEEAIERGGFWWHGGDVPDSSFRKTRAVQTSIPGIGFRVAAMKEKAQ